MDNQNNQQQSQQQQGGTTQQQQNQVQQQNQAQQQNQTQQQTQQQEGKNYTQQQLNAMMANEKRTARQAILKELGFEVSGDDKSFADTLAGIKKTLDAGKTQQQLDQEAKNKAEGEAKDANARAALAEMKVSALTAGVKPDRLDDMIILAQAKIAGGQKADQAFADLKKNYPDAFGVASSGGTGSHVNPANKTGNDGENRGTRLAKQNKPPVKSSYFKH